MVQEISIISDPVMLHVWSCLHNYAYEDALFAAERLYAETRSSESLYLLATSLYRVGRPKQVSRLLNSFEPLSPKSRYLLAKCYFDFGQFRESEETLLGPALSPHSIEELSELYGEQAEYAALLLGNLYRRQGKITDASRCYEKCLEINPLLWSAYKHLCDIGDFPNPASTFRLKEGLSLPTPTYRFLHQTVDLGSNCTDYQSFLNQGIGVKNDLETVHSRENMNPAESHDDSTIPPTAPVKEKQEFNESSILHRTYVSHCCNDSNLNITQPMSAMQTPQGNFSIPVVPKAPKAEHPSRAPMKSAMIGQGSMLELPVQNTPKFGTLAMLSQSPMFACVPVFHRQSTTSESILSTSVRYGQNQTAPLRPSDQNESVPLIASNLRRIPLVSAGSTATTTTSRRRSRPGEPDPSTRSTNGLLHTTSPGSADKAPHGLHGNSEQSTTSTPANVTNSLRRLIFSGSPSSTCVPPTSLATIIPSTLPIQRAEPPVLRSQRSMPSSFGSALVSHRTGVPLLNLNSPGGIVSSCSTPRPSISQDLRRRTTMEASIPDEDDQSNAPRTRSQVAAAAAFARASGIQRRSNRLVRSRGMTRRLENRNTPSSSGPITSPGNSDNLEDSPGAVDQSIRTHEEAISSFGCMQTNSSEEHVIVEVPVTKQDDLRVTSLQKYLKLLVHLGKAYQLFVQHDWRSATRLLSKLPSSQLITGRVLSWAARAHIDNTDYTVARKLFNEVRRLEPWQLIGMDFYSTVLWQLQADDELSHLAHELLELDRSAPEPWCVAGNCFSLQGEHEVAIRFFQRAIQMCPTSAYAYTLLGHEQSTLEEFDRALSAFRYALQLDPRQYNAMFGMGNVYYKQEKYELAETHLSMAVEVFPHSPLLLTNLGVLRGRLGELDDGSSSALQLVTRACRLQPNNPLARYHRSSILFHLGRYPEVLEELQKLLILTPREAMVYLMIGHTHKKLGNTPQAMIHYSWAMGLDPKGANTHLRDIMTNPPVSGRNMSRRNVGDSARVDNGTTNTVVRGAGRAHLIALPDGTRSEEDEELDTGLSPADRAFTDSDIRSVGDDTMDGMFNDTQFTGTDSSRQRASARRLTDFSLPYVSEDPLFSDTEEDEHDRYETMDLGPDDDSGHSAVDD